MSDAPGASASPPGRSTAVAALVAGAVLLFLAAWHRDLLTGAARPFYRDLSTTQAPARALWSALGPASWNPAASFGQPYYGNPNLVLAYPFPRDPRRLGLHLLAHVALGAAGAFALARALGLSPAGALVTALSWGLSGYVLSSTAFLNATTTLAWGPWAVAAAAAARGAAGRRLALAILGGAAAFALLVLGGEPALGGLFLAVAGGVALDAPGRRVRSLAALAVSGVLAALACLPWILEVLRASSFSSRRVRGFSFAEFSAAFWHPARLLETPFPGLFGDPTRLVSGAWWGFETTQGNPPYLASLSFGVVPATLALVLAASPRRREGRLFLVVGAAGLALSLFPVWPGARALYDAMPAIHVVRYPLKALVLTFLSVAVLAGLSADRVLRADALPGFRRRASIGASVAGALVAAVGAGILASPATARDLLARWFWDPAWVSPAATVLAPIVARLPGQAALAAAALFLVAVLLRRGATDGRGQGLLLGGLAGTLLAGAGHPVPALPSTLFASPPPLAAAARAIPGRVFERTGKDVDAVRRGLFGRAPEDDLASVGLAQTRQAWALAGAEWGLHYAYDSDPDGSYTILTRLGRDAVLAHDLPGQIKWLRSAGVGSLIAHDVPVGTPGLERVAIEDVAGIPTALWRLTAPLPGVRRCSRVHAATSVTEAVRRFDRDDFDPATDVVLAGHAPPGVGADRLDPSARARVERAAADALRISTDGSFPAILLVDRSFTPDVRARVDGRDVRPYAANVHLLGIPVPAGRSTVEIDLAP